MTKVPRSTSRRCRVHLAGKALVHADTPRRRTASAWIGTAPAQTSTFPQEETTGRDGGCDGGA